MSSDNVVPLRYETEIDEYQILHPIGKGAFSLVYSARHLRFDRIDAFKILHLRPTKDELDQYKENLEGLLDEKKDRFNRECKLLASVEHKNIVRAYSTGEYLGHPYLAMEFVNGENLRDKMNRGFIKPLDALRYLREICDALVAIHGSGIIHRDIKPQNIFISNFNDVKLGDFGIAKDADEAIGITRQSLINLGKEHESVGMGTLHYAAPEQLACQDDLDQKADIYALGSLFYDMLTGMGSRGKTFNDVKFWANLEHKPPPSQYRQDLGTDFDRLALALTQTNRRKRLDSVQALGVIDTLIKKLERGSSPTDFDFSNPPPNYDLNYIKRFMDFNDEEWLHHIGPLLLIRVDTFGLNVNNPHYMNTEIDYLSFHIRNHQFPHILSSINKKASKIGFTIGRSQMQGCDFIIAKDKSVSRKHLDLRISGNNLIATPQNTTNVTTVNHSVINEPTEIKYGDVLGIGHTYYVPIPSLVFKRELENDGDSTRKISAEVILQHARKSGTEKMQRP